MTTFKLKQDVLYGCTETALETRNLLVRNVPVSEPTVIKRLREVGLKSYVISVLISWMERRRPGGIVKKELYRKVILVLPTYITKVL